MTNTVNVDDKNIATVEITVDANVARDLYERTLKSYAANINISGFRKGKAPTNVVEKYVGAERIKVEVVDRLFPSEFQKVIEEHNLYIAFRPAIEEFTFDLGSDLKIKAKVELKPEVKLGNIKDVEVEYKEFKNPENALDEELAHTQRRFSTLEKVDRESTDKDTVVFDFEGFVGDEKIEHGDAKNYTLDLANSNFIPGFAEGLVGHKAGEEFTINVKFPEEYHEDKLKGADAQFKIKLHEVKERKLPELNDELAKKAGKDTLDALKEDIKNYLTAMETNRNNSTKSEAIFDKIVETTEIKVQDTMLDREYNAIVEEAKMQAKQQNADYDKLVEAEGKESVEKRFRQEAEKRIKNSLIVEKIAEVANLRIEQKDIMEHVNQMAAMYGMSAVQLFEELRKNPSSFAAISQQITASKVNQYLLENNKFVAKV
ncbi:MAG: trigger factor [Candidatus Gastranaerophilales bacterium]|nr:trigger factor [Candidatus Gastranaerophilales bacterium]